MSVSLSRQYDAFLWFDETHALSPLIARQSETGQEETFPFGFESEPEPIDALRCQRPRISM